MYIVMQLSAELWHQPKSEMHLGVIAKLLYWMKLDCRGVPNKLETPVS